MNTMNWVAIIGAAAWTPHIIEWLYKFFTRPKITLYPHKNPSIGYTIFGPIINIDLALLSGNREITLNNFSINIKHENGAEFTFDWNGLSESLSEIQGPSGLPTSIKKEYLPLVVRIVPLGLAQALVRYQYEPFKRKYRDAVQAVDSRFLALRKAGKINTEKDIDGLTSEREVSELFDLINSEFIWVAGNYTLMFDFKSPSKFSYVKKKYTFSLTQEDVDELRKNIDGIKLSLAETAKTIALKDYEAKEISWIWRNPELQEKS
jgi:hypothetical protein